MVINTLGTPLGRHTVLEVLWPHLLGHTQMQAQG